MKSSTLLWLLVRKDIKKNWNILILSMLIQKKRKKNQMLWIWIVSQEGFSIKWWHIFRTCLTNEKTTFFLQHNPNVAKNMPKEVFSWNLTILFKTNENIVIKLFLIIIFLILVKFCIRNMLIFIKWNQGWTALWI